MSGTSGGRVLQKPLRWGALGDRILGTHQGRLAFIMGQLTGGLVIWLGCSGERRTLRQQTKALKSANLLPPCWVSPGCDGVPFIGSRELVCRAYLTVCT